MKLTFLGATHEVTGSCFYLEAAGHRLVIDCGMEQGADSFENQELPVAASQVDAVLLTHAHIDHSGRLPLLYKQGFRGPVWATRATCDLCDIMLRDSAHIQMFEAEWRNRKGRRAGREEFLPLYDMDDAQGVIGLLEGVAYQQEFEVLPGIRARFCDVGHLLGSACIELWVTEGEEQRKLVFSGDVGNTDQPLIRDPQYLAEADYVVTECTYGDRSHGPRPDYLQELAGLLQRTFDRGGNVVVPSFAVGRTQEMLYFLRQIKDQGLVRGHEGFAVYVDSPLAIEATNVFYKNGPEYYDSDALALLDQAINPLSFSDLKIAVTSDESKAINFDQAPKVILSASGMCEAGRIRHHLKHNLWRPESTVVFVGYQAEGTLGRALLEGAPSVRLFGEEIEVKAEIARLAGVSGHADREGLLRWLESFSPRPRRVFVVHGDDEVCQSYTQLLEQKGYTADAPYSGDQFDLLAGAWAHREKPVPIQKASPAGDRASQIFRRLQAAGKRLLTVIEHNRGGANKDLARFASQIDSLCDKWDR